MTLQFRAKWNQIPPNFANGDDAAMIPMLSPDEDSVRDVIHDASNYGGFSDARVLRMFTAALSPKGPIVSVRAGAHQIEPEGNGFRLHIGTLFDGVNFHLNLQQTDMGTLYITSVTWGAPKTPNWGQDVRTGSPPL